MSQCGAQRLGILVSGAKSNHCNMNIQTEHLCIVDLIFASTSPTSLIQAVRGRAPQS